MKLLHAIANLRLSQKLFLSFALIIVIPLLISYSVYKREADEILVSRVFQDTLTSLEVVSTRVEDILRRMTYISLYVNNDEKIQAIVKMNPRGRGDHAQSKLEDFNRVKTVNSIFENLSFNILRVKSYFSLIIPSGTYTSWPFGGPVGEAYLKNHAWGQAPNYGLYVHWEGLEPNYVTSDSADYPYVLTLMKSITDRYGTKHFGTFILSVPEMEISRLMFRDNLNASWFLLDHRGIIISSSRKELLGNHFFSVYPISVPEDVSGYFVTHLQETGKALITFHKLRGQDWTFFNIESYASITQELAAVHRRLVAVNLMQLALFIGVAGLIARGISKPLRALTTEMLNIKIAQSPASKKTIHRSDEIGILEKSFVTMRTRINRLLGEIARNEQKKREAELEALLLQISPHFLFNTLNTIRWAIINGNQHKAAEMILELARLLRSTLSKGSELISLNEEIDILRSYVSILKMRQESDFELSCTVDDNLKEKMIPRLLLQPIVENAVIHGFTDLEKAGSIDISAVETNGDLIITVRDNGKGTDLSRVHEPQNAKCIRFSGIGIDNVDERIKLHFGDRYGLQIESQIGQGTTVRISIPSL
ncbi:MAG TPA: sensor histidine kinase [candidate division Zixibacteria bacterium]|nr:sensor histidine kinase [candidate division Zixibacteria bacterium]